MKSFFPDTVLISYIVLSDRKEYFVWNYKTQHDKTIVSHWRECCISLLFLLFIFFWRTTSKKSGMNGWDNLSALHFAKSIIIQFKHMLERHFIKVGFS